MSQSAIEGMKKSLKKKVTDRFKVGDVVRWTASNRYTYAAIKTNAGWFTTASRTNSFVSSYLAYEELLDILGKSETSDIQVSTEWVEVEV